MERAILSFAPSQMPRKSSAYDAAGTASPFRLCFSFDFETSSDNLTGCVLPSLSKSESYPFDEL